MGERARTRDRIVAALGAADFPRSLESLAGIDPKKRLGPLFSALLAPEALTRWRAVVALGAAAAELAGQRPEEARDFWRNCMWRLNEESGTIAWGIPEVMGETLARSPVLAEAYHRILFSYVRDLPGDSTYLDHAPLRRGVWWAMARLAETRPELVRLALPDLAAALDDPDPAARGLACLALLRLRPRAATPLKEKLAALARDDRATFDLFRDGRLATADVVALAAEALAACDPV